MAKVGRTPELSRVRRRWVKEDEVKELSCTVVVEMWRTFERQQTSRAFVDKGIAAKATGLSRIRSLQEREGEEGTVWKRVCKGDAMVVGGRGWAETARTYIAGGWP
jgi:hypothetical protein